MNVLQTAHEHIDVALTQAISPLAPSGCKILVSKTLGSGGDDLVPSQLVSIVVILLLLLVDLLSS